MTTFRGAFRSVNANYWNHGMHLSDWSANGGSQMWRDGISAGLIDLGGRLYSYENGGLVEQTEFNGRFGTWEGFADVVIDSDSPAGYEWFVSHRFVEAKRQQTQERPSFWGRIGEGFGVIGDRLFGWKVNDYAQIVIIGKGNEQFALKNVGNGIIGYMKLGDPTDVWTILNLRLTDKPLDAFIEGRGIYLEDPRNRYTGSFLFPSDRLYDYREVGPTEMVNWSPGHYRFLGGEGIDPSFTKVLYTYEKQGDFHIMRKTNIPWTP